MTTGRDKITRGVIVFILMLVSAGTLFLLRPRSGEPLDSPNGRQSVGSTEQRGGGSVGQRANLANPAPQKPPFHFEYMTPQTGIDFVYYGSPSREAYMTEQNGGGVALIDFDNDGQLDLFFVNGSTFRQPKTDLTTSNRLYRAVGDFKYEDVTLSAGLFAHGFGMGCAAGDYDNDGFIDIFVAYYGRDRMWRNNGDGTFSEVTDEAGVGSDRWGTSAAFADLDADGLLDLYVVNYVDWSPNEPTCHPPGHPKINGVCSPIERSGQADLLYRNTGNGRFDEIGVEAGIARDKDGKGLALAIADFDGDGRLDIYVANDTSPNFLFHNLGNMRFEEVGVLEGVAISSDGIAGASMGVACADYDHNGYLDLCVTNFRNQVKDVFANLGPAGFKATNTTLGVDLALRSTLGFGVVLADFNLDTWPDLFVANGHIWDLTAVGTEYEYKMYPQLLSNQQGRRFADVSSQSGDYFHQRWLGRAVAFGDLDNDGDADLVVTHLTAPPAVLRNDSERAGQGLRLNLIGTRSSRQALGCQVTTVAGQLRQATQVPSGGSFQASHDPRVLVTTGATSPIDEIQVVWPGGQIETWKNPTLNHRGAIHLVEGIGTNPHREDSTLRNR